VTKAELKLSAVDRLAQRLFASFVYAVIAAIVLHYFMESWGFRYDVRGCSFAEIVSFRSQRPFCFRVLMPLAINAIARLVPHSVILTNSEWLLHSSTLMAFEKDRIAKGGWSLDLSVKYHIAYLLCYVAILVFMVLLRFLIVAIYRPSPCAATFGSAVFVLLLPLTYLNGGYLYDFPELTLCALYLLAVFYERKFISVIIFGLAVLNKESDVFLVIYFIAYMLCMKRSRTTLFVWGMAHAVLGTLIVIGIRYLFRNNGGNSVAYFFPQNLQFWTRFRSYLFFIAPFSPLIRMPRGPNVLVIAFFTWAFVSGRKQIPRWLALGFVAMLLVYFPLMLVWGFFDEIRVCGPLFPAMMTMAFPATFGADCSPCDSSQGRDSVGTVVHRVSAS
jgi:hypothetical protein